MNQVKSLIELFRLHGDQLTLLQMKQNFEVIGSNETGRISDAREVLKKQGKTIVLIYKDLDHPSKNTYAIMPFIDHGQRLICV
jgi:hypothetical protein